MIQRKIDDFTSVFIGEDITRRAVKLFSSPNAKIPTPEFALGMTIIAPGQQHEVHVHDLNSEIQVIYNGKGIMKGGAEDVEISKGDVIYLGVNEPHGFVNTGDDDLCILWIYYPTGLAEKKFLADDWRA